MDNNTVIKVENLGKKYKIGQIIKHPTLRDALSATNSLWSSNNKDNNEIWALKNISFEVNQGDIVGIIGKNGSGKSTLLKILTRITEPTEGEVTMHGRVASLLEVGTGFNPELTGRENVYLNGSILGMSKDEIHSHFEEIVSFSGVKKFLDTPVKRYSSGMYVRLAFAVAAHLESEILLIDEVLAVGDAAFQKKCLGKMNNLAKSGKTVLFVSHSMQAIRNLCNKYLWIDDGKVKEFSSDQSLTERYLSKTIKTSKKNEYKKKEKESKKALELVYARMINDENEIASIFNCEQEIKIELKIILRKPVYNLLGYLSITSPEGNVILVSDTNDIEKGSIDNLKRGENSVVITIPKRTLGHGDYLVYLNFTGLRNNAIENIESPGVILKFSVIDCFTERGNTRGGYFSTLLKWDLKK
jgi:lipopolysaccharide transport system ATP-binding protein